MWKFNNQHWNENGLCYDGATNLTDDQWLRTEQVCNNLSDKTFSKRLHFLTNDNVNYTFYLEVLQHGGKRWKRYDLGSDKCIISHCSICETISDATSSLFSQFGSLWLVCIATNTGTFWVTEGGSTAYITHIKSDNKTCTPEMIPKYGRKQLCVQLQKGRG